MILEGIQWLILGYLLYITWLTRSEQLREQVDRIMKGD